MKKHEIIDLHQQLGSTLDDAIKELLYTVDLKEEQSSDFVLSTIKLLEDSDFRLNITNALYESLNKNKEDKKSIVKRAGTHVANDVANYATSIATGTGGVYVARIEKNAENSVSRAISNLIKYQRYSPTRRVIKNVKLAKRMALIGAATLALVTAAKAYKVYKFTKMKCIHRNNNPDKSNECRMLAIKAAERFLINRSFDCKDSKDPKDCEKRVKEKIKIWRNRYAQIKKRSALIKNAERIAARNIKKL
jgi:hypothetical protein